MAELSHIWMVRTSMRELHGRDHVGAETESEARGLVQKKRQGETIVGAKHIRNVEHVRAHELRPVQTGPHWGPTPRIQWRRFAPRIVRNTTEFLKNCRAWYRAMQSAHDYGLRGLDAMDAAVQTPIVMPRWHFTDC